MNIQNVKPSAIAQAKKLRDRLPEKRVKREKDREREAKKMTSKKDPYEDESIGRFENEGNSRIGSEENY